MIVCHSPMWNSVPTLPTATSAMPVGAAIVAPSPCVDHPDRNASSRSDGLSGYGTNCPNVGTPSVIRWRAPIDREHEDHDPGDRRCRAGGLPPAPLGARLRRERPTVARAQVRRQAGAATHLQPGDLAARDVAQRGDVSPAANDRRDARHHADERLQRVQRLARPRRDESDDEFGERHDDQLEQHPRQPRRAGQGGHRTHPVTGLHRADAQVRTPIGQTLAVATASARHDDDAGASEVRSPAQVDVVAVEPHGRIEALQRAEQVGAHQQAGRRDGEHVAHRVVLLLIDLAGLDQRVDLTEAVDSQADVLQQARFVPVDQLRPDDPGVRAVQLLDEQADGAGAQGDVVVQHAEEAVVALDEMEHLVRRGAVSRIAVERADERRGQLAADLLVHRGGIARHQEEVAQ